MRLHGIDAEELNEPNGLKAKAMMQFIIGSNQVTCNLNGGKSYERYVGTCYVKGIDLGIAMVAAGYALDCAHYSHGVYRQFEPSDARKHLIQKPYCYRTAYTVISLPSLLRGQRNNRTGNHATSANTASHLS